MSSSPLLMENRFINVAAGKAASQSTLSPWSTELGAKEVLIKDESRDFGFHTAEEDAPWWQVDLQDIYPIEAIVLYNRRDQCRERARTVSVSVSTDGEVWTMVHSGLAYFGHGPDGPPLNLPLGSRVHGRFVRLQLHERTHFHLWHVAVMVEAAIWRAFELRAELDLNFPLRDIDPKGKGNAGYDVIASRAEDIAGPLIGLAINDNGAFGNSVMQYATAVEVAQFLGLKYVSAAKGKLVNLPGPVSIGGIEVLPAGAQLPDSGCFLRGNFFFRNHLENALKNSTSGSYHELIRTGIKRLYGSIDFNNVASHPDDELAIHLRAGDIFRTWVHADYVQPPLAFYELVIKRLVAEKQVHRVRLVFEDRGNPVIDVLEARLKASGIPVICQSGSVEEDILALIDARHLAFGVGTFGTAIAQLSGPIHSVYYFSPTGSCPFANIPNIRHVVHVIDKAGDYIKIGSWANTPEQYRTMIEYPVEKLGVASEWTHPVDYRAELTQTFDPRF